MNHTRFSLIGMFGGFLLAFLIIADILICSEWIWRYWAMIPNLFLLAISIGYLIRFINFNLDINVLNSEEEDKNDAI